MAPFFTYGNPKMKKMHSVFRTLKQFVTSKDKVPFDFDNNVKINPYDEKYWITGVDAFLSGHEANFIINNGWFLIDIDHCIDADYSMSDIAIEIMMKFQNCYIEVSRSRTGLHIIGRLSNTYKHNCKNTDLGLECYTDKRSVCLTGFNSSGNPSYIADEEMQWFIDKYMKPADDSELFTEWTNEPVPEWEGPRSDASLISRMLKSKKVSKLWNGDISDYNNDHSSADVALCMHLAFWTGKNCERIENLFNMSKLADRDKWRDRADYRKRTILSACSQVTLVASLPKGDLEKCEAEYEAEDINKEGNFCTIEMQKKLFGNCVYLETGCRVFDKSKHRVIDKNEFNGIYNQYMFQMDWDCEKYTEDAYKAFRDNRAYKKVSVDDVRYEPSEPYGKILEGIEWSGYEGIRYVNAFGFPQVKKVSGDAQFFLDFIKKLIPNDRDRKILYGYMAGVAQNKGKKIRWCPVLQGTQGNGKTTIMRVMEYIVGRQVSITKLAKEAFADNYNGWMEGKIFVGLDEMMKDTARENHDKLNNFITGHEIAIRRMYTDWIHYRNFVNFMVCTNFKDAIEINADTRRWCIFYTAQQTNEDLIRDGLTADFFIKLTNWLDNENGFAILADYFSNYKIEDEFNPFMQSRAPKTTSLDEATVDSLPPSVKKIMEAVDEGLKGFRGGWISTAAISVVLGFKVYRWKEIGDALNRLGYIKIEKRTSLLPVINTLPLTGGMYQPHSKIKHSVFVHKSKKIDENTITDDFYNDQSDTE